MQRNQSPVTQARVFENLGGKIGTASVQLAFAETELETMKMTLQRAEEQIRKMWERTRDMVRAGKLTQVEAEHLVGNPAFSSWLAKEIDAPGANFDPTAIKKTSFAKGTPEAGGDGSDQ